MKKLFFLGFAIILMMGCEHDPGVQGYAEGFRISVIDSCEYIRYSNGWGPEYTHKGNCKFCQERRKRELRELGLKTLKGD